MGRLFNLHPTRPFPVADRMRDGTPVESMHPRLAAIRLLREHIADRRAGLDPYDPSIFILDAHEHERTWAYRCLELTGRVLDFRRFGDGTRLRATLEADVRHELGLDTLDPPTMADEPLASRGVGHAEVAEIVNRHIDELARPDANLRVLTLDRGRLSDEKGSQAMAALERACSAWALRYDRDEVQ